MAEFAALLVMGLERGELTVLVGAAGGVASSVVVLAMLGLTLLPAYSERWAERLGVADEAGGSDPVDVVPGRDAPLPAPGAGGGSVDVTGGPAPQDVADDAALAEPDEAPVADGGDPA